MAGFTRAGRERINVFSVEETYLFRHYVDDEAFEELRRFYSRHEYRFEVPAESFDRARSVLEDHGYDPVLVEEIEPYAVVKRKYTDHPDVLFSESVLHRGLGRFNCFVLADREAVERALGAGATALAATDLELEL